MAKNRAAFNDPYEFMTGVLCEEPSCIRKRMFGCLAYYLFGELKLVIAGQGDAPWDGILLPTDRDRHAALQAEFPALVSHPVLGKWLYISEDHPRFERTVREVVAAIVQNDPRIGVIPGQKKKKPQKKKGRGQDQKTL